MFSMRSEIRCDAPFCRSCARVRGRLGKSLRACRSAGRRCRGICACSKTPGLVQVREEGTRNLYSIRMQGFASVRDFVDDFWDTALARLEELARR